MAGRRLQNGTDRLWRGVRPGQGALFFFFCVCSLLSFRFLSHTVHVLPEGFSDPGKYHEEYSRDEPG